MIFKKNLEKNTRSNILKILKTIIFEIQKKKYMSRNYMSWKIIWVEIILVEFIWNAIIWVEIIGNVTEPIISIHKIFFFIS